MTMAWPLLLTLSLSALVIALVIALSALVIALVIALVNAFRDLPARATIAWYLSLTLSLPLPLSLHFVFALVFPMVTTGHTKRKVKP